MSIRNTAAVQHGWRPKFIREIREHAARDGMVQATHDILQRDNVSVRAVGHLDAIQQHSGGLLFIGNHNRQFEFVALMDVLSQIGRTSMKHIVKCYVEQQVTWALGEPARDAVLPVWPRLLDKDRKNKFNMELSSRIMFNRSLKYAVDARRATDESLMASAQELSDGRVVNIFPCGSIVNNMKKPWRTGVGRILTMVPEEDRSHTLVVPYHADNINRARLVAAVAVRGRGVLGRPQSIDLTVGQPQTMAEVMDALPKEASRQPDAITDALRMHYMTQFS